MNDPAFPPDSAHSAAPPAGTPAAASPGPAAKPGPARRRPPAWMIALPLMALTGYGGYLLGNKPSDSSSNFGPGASSGVSQGMSGRTGGSGRGGTGTSGAATSGATAGSGSGRTAGGAAGSEASGGTGNRFRRSQQAGESGNAASSGASSSGAASGTNAAATAETASGSASSQTGSTGRRRFRRTVIAVTAAEVHAGKLTTDRTTTGTVAAAQSTSVNTRTSGTVSAVAGAVGQQVRAGQVVVRLTSSDLNASVDSARNALASAQSQLSNQTATLDAAREQLQQNVQSAQLSLSNAQTTLAAQQKLYAIGAVARSAVDAQQVAVQQARSSLANAQTSLNQNTISRTTGLRDLQLAVDKARISLQQAQDSASNVNVVAPFDGQITALPVTTGEYLNAGTTTFSLTSTSRNLTFNVPPAQAPSLTVGRQLTFKVGQTSYPIKVSANPGAATNGVVPITARFTGGTFPAAGTVGAVSYSTVVGQGVLVPTTSLQIDDDQTGVFVVEDGKAALKTVQVIGQTGDTAVVSGLDDGAQVITTPPAGLLDGARVDTSGARAGAGGAGGPPGGMP